jgi:hypothetical protein
VGLAPTGKRRLVTAHTHFGRSPTAHWAVGTAHLGQAARVCCRPYLLAITQSRAFEIFLENASEYALSAQGPSRCRPNGRTGDQDEDNADGNSPASYDDDGGNTAQNARIAVIGRLNRDKDKTGRPASATRKFDLDGRKAKITVRVQKFLTMCPGARDNEGLGHVLSRKRVRKALEGRPSAANRVPRAAAFSRTPVNQSLYSQIRSLV